MGSDGKAGVEHEDAAISPGSEEAAFVGWCSEAGVVVFECDVDVL